MFKGLNNRNSSVISAKKTSIHWEPGGRFFPCVWCGSLIGSICFRTSFFLPGNVASEMEMIVGLHILVSIIDTSIC
jgi:formate/nitrite transporter FocA (FNT family)